MIVSVLFLLLIYDGEAHITCDNPITNISLTTVPGTGHSNNRVKRAAQSLRISTYYDPSFTSLSNKDDIIRLVLNPTIQFWQDALQAKYPLSSPLLIDRNCPLGYYLVKKGADTVKVCLGYCSDRVCVTTTVPSRYMKKCYTGNSVSFSESGSEGSGAENTDLLILVTQIATDCTNTTVLNVAPCELEHGHDRPVLGILNICPGKIDTVNGVNQAIAILKHGMAHILGVNSNLFAFYRDECDNPRTPRDSNGFPNLGIKTVGTYSIYQYSSSTVLDTEKYYGYRTGSVPTKISYMVTPTVRSEIRNHFNCPSLEGLMLENYGDSISSVSHFEKLYLQDELMTPTISAKPRLSRLTLAVLQDTGWYNVNFDKAEYFDFGKNMGCNFVTRSCLDFMRGQQASGASFLPYCNIFLSSVPQCGSDQKDVSYCDLYNNPTLAALIPLQFKYFNDINLVSFNPFSDYCPMILVIVCNNSSNIELQCNNADRPCTGGPIPTCQTTTYPAYKEYTTTSPDNKGSTTTSPDNTGYTTTSPDNKRSTTTCREIFFWSCKSADVTYKMSAWLCSMFLLINDYII